jgi:hypothetical protein
MNAPTMDTPMYRDLYRAIRFRTVTLAGGTNKDFNRAVELELGFLELDPSPLNWVLCAATVEHDEFQRYAYEMELAQEQAEDDAHNARWEAALEAKYDFMKES